WQQAISEFQQAGEKPPSSSDLARVYDEWGEHLSADGQYAAALANFDVVLRTYGEATHEVTRAQQGTVVAYLAWGKQAVEAHQYDEAIHRLDAVLGLTYCDATCQGTASSLDATAYFQQAEASLASTSYASAVTLFRALLSRFPSSPEAGQAHPELAKA